MGRSRTKGEGQRDCERKHGVAVLVGGALIFLAGRRSRSDSPAADGKDKEVAPKPPERTFLEKVARWITWPVRKADQAKRELEENPKQPAEPEKDTSKKLSIGCVTLNCGETPDAKAGEDKKEAEKKGDEAGGLTSIAVKVLGVIAAGIGVTGAVTVVGASIFWARFDAMDVPMVQAVTAIPKAELLVQGTQETMIFVLIGLGATLLIALADPKGIVTRGTLIVLSLLIAGAGGYLLCTSLNGGWVLVLFGAALALAVICILIAFNTGRRLVPLLVSVFLASFLFSWACAFVIVEMQKYAQAISIRFSPSTADEKEGPGLIGIYVAVTDDTIYFARADPDADGGEDEDRAADDTGLYEVPRTDAVTYAVGPLEPIEKENGGQPVKTRGKILLSRLKKDAKSFPPPPKAETPEEETGSEDAAGAGGT